MTNAAPLQSATAKPLQAARANLFLQRKCACGGATGIASECEECRREKLLQRRAAGQTTPPAVPPVVHDVLRSPGQPVGAKARTFMGSHLGHDFSHVRVHADARAAKSARTVGAHAYTVGHHIVFAEGHYAPGTTSGLGLLAHELTHVVQQQQLGNAAPQYRLEVGPHDDRFELEADSAADAVLKGQPIDHAPSVLQRPILQRLPLGFLAPLVGGAIGVIALLLSEGSFSDRELQAYLEHLATRRRIEGGYFSDNKARAIVKRWTAGDSKYDLNRGYTSRSAEISAVDLKRLLIKEMLDGRPGEGDQKSILTILENSSNEEVLKILDPAQGVSVQALDDNLAGKNQTRFAAMLETRFPQLGAAHVLRTGELSCDARQAIMLEFAQEQAAKVLAAAIPRLSEFLGATPDTRRNTLGDIQSAVHCYFPGARDEDVSRIKQVYENAQLHLGNAQYRCFPEGAERVTITIEGVPQLQGQQRELEIPKSSLAQTPFFEESPGVHTADRRTFIAPIFFKALGPVQQAVTLVHEAIHRVDFAIEDIDYDLPCEKLNLNQAKKNSESFTLLALRLLERAPGTIAFKGKLPSVLLGNFRNEGPISKENECEECPFLPDLGLETTDTARNFMELRGDITGHRAGVEYDFARTKERAIWKRVGGAWTLLNYAPPGTDDNLLKNDQDVTPKNNHIYDVDGPGLEQANHPVPDPSADEAVFRATFVESVLARLGRGVWSRVSNDFPWHSVTWMEKVNGKWRRKPGANEIAPGRITIGKTPPA